VLRAAGDEHVPHEHRVPEQGVHERLLGLPLPREVCQVGGRRGGEHGAEGQLGVRAALSEAVEGGWGRGRGRGKRCVECLVRKCLGGGRGA
jgi:hypothetical protein